MRVVVTGASGFLGRTLMRQLSQLGIEVLGVSRRALPGFIQVETYQDTPHGDILVHLAEASDRCTVETSGSEYTQATLATLKSLIRNKFRRLVYTSSAVLYGDQSESLHKPSDPVCLVDIYTRLKYESEQTVLDQGGIVARFVNLFGPGMAQSNVLSAILRQVPFDGPLRVRDITPVRDFLWIDDAADALVAMVLGSATGVFNVGTGKGTSVYQLANIVLDAARQTGRQIESAQQDSKPSHLIVDIERTVEQLKWQPSKSLPQGIDILLNEMMHKDL